MNDAAVLEVKQQYLTYSMMASTRGHCKDLINFCLYGTQWRDARHHSCPSVSVQSLKVLNDLLSLNYCISV